MKAFFAEISPEELVNYGDSVFTVATETGEVKHFEQVVEYGSNAGGTDEFVISDSIGRYVPIGVDQLDTLINILTDLRDTVEEMADAEDFCAEVLNAENATIY
jgi:hypothetical protein